MRRLFIPDTHFPDVDLKAFNTMLNQAKDYKPEQVVILGDWFDCYSISRFDKSPERMVLALEEELQTGIEAIQTVIKILRPKHLYFLVGNHEHRITRYVQQNAPLIHGLLAPLHQLFQLPTNSTLVPYNRFLRFDNLAVHHGIAVGKNCAAKMLDLLGGNVLFGHTHKLQQTSKRLYAGKTITAYSCGWLGSFETAGEYMQHADWQHGYATGFFPKSGKWQVQLHEIK